MIALGMPLAVEYHPGRGLAMVRSPSVPKNVSRPRRPMAPSLVPRLRVLYRGTILLGPGKADLLEAIAEEGELRLAAKKLGMSYMRAWKLLQMMNTSFREPLVTTSRGGSQRGASTLTPAGRAVLRLYREMEKSSQRAAARSWRELQALIRI